jgi:hypothetical protein
VAGRGGPPPLLIGHTGGLPGGPVATTMDWPKWVSPLPLVDQRGEASMAIPKPLVGLPNRKLFFHTLGSICFQKSCRSSSKSFRFMAFYFFSNFFCSCKRHRVAS